MLILITGGSSSGKSAFAEKTALEMRNRFDRQAASRMIYIATMEPFTEDAKEKIKHHHELRAGKGFLTLEQYSDLKKTIPKLENPNSGCKDVPEEKTSAGNGERVSEPMVQREKVFAGNGERVSEPMVQRKKASAGDRKPTRKPVVLLECLSNLLANEMFAPEITEGMRAKATFGTELCEKICADILALEAAASCLIVVSCNVSEDGASYPWETVKYIHILEQIQVRIAKEAERVYEVVCGIPVLLKE